MLLPNSSSTSIHDMHDLPTPSFFCYMCSHGSFSHLPTASIFRHSWLQHSALLTELVKKKKEKRQHKHNKMYSAKNMSFTFKDKCILFKLSKMKIVYLWNKVQQLHCISLFWGGIHLHIPLHRKRLVYIEQELDIL